MSAIEELLAAGLLPARRSRRPGVAKRGARRRRAPCRRRLRREYRRPRRAKANPAHRASAPTPRRAPAARGRHRLAPSGVFALAAMSDRTWLMELSLDAIGSARAVLIAGPTASGKSAAALGLAEEAARRGRAAWIVNADAMQVYDALRVADRAAERGRRGARAAPPLRPRRRPRALFGRRLARGRREGAARGGRRGRAGHRRRRHRPLFQGADGGARRDPDIPTDVRSAWAERLEAEGVARLHAALSQRDPASRPRSGRAIRSVCSARSKCSTSPAARSTNGRRCRRPRRFSHRTTRRASSSSRSATTLHRRIEERFDRMVERGRDRGGRGASGAAARPGLCRR